MFKYIHFSITLFYKPGFHSCQVRILASETALLTSPKNYCCPIYQVNPKHSNILPRLSPFNFLPIATAHSIIIWNCCFFWKVVSSLLLCTTLQHRWGKLGTFASLPLQKLPTSRLTLNSSSFSNCWVVIYELSMTLIYFHVCYLIRHTGRYDKRLNSVLRPKMPPCAYFINKYNSCSIKDPHKKQSQCCIWLFGGPSEHSWLEVWVFFVVTHFPSVFQSWETLKMPWKLNPMQLCSIKAW